MKEFSNVNPQMLSLAEIREEAYQQGRADAIDECIAILKEDWKWVNKNSAIAMHLILEYERRLEQLKEQNNESLD